MFDLKVKRSLSEETYMMLNSESVVKYTSVTCIIQDCLKLEMPFPKGKAQRVQGELEVNDQTIVPFP